MFQRTADGTREGDVTFTFDVSKRETASGVDDTWFPHAKPSDHGSNHPVHGMDSLAVMVRSGTPVKLKVPRAARSPSTPDASMSPSMPQTTLPACQL